MREWTRDNFGAVSCPWCGKGLDDLWDYGWGDGDEVADVDCGWCEKPVYLSREVDVIYRIAKRDQGGDDE